MSIEYQYLFNEFVKYHIPVFKIMDKKDSYSFCTAILCSDCNIQHTCSINQPGIHIPSISKERYTEIMKNHPEYKI